MSRKSRTTLYLRVKVPLPSGVTIPQLTAYVKEAVGGWNGGFDPQDPLFNLSREEIIVSVEKRETVYL